MLKTLRQIAKRSPLGSVVRWVRARCVSPPPALDPVAQQHLAYDRDTLAIMRRVLTGSAVAIDGGSHEGAILREMLTIAPQGRHFAFEPIPHLAEGLRVSYPTVRVHQKAIGEAPGTATFQHVVNDPGYSGLRFRDYDRSDPVFNELTVEVVRIDDVVGPADQVAFIKLDLEGGEYHAMRGALGTVRRCRPVIVFEAARRSTGFYGVSAGQLFDLIVTEMGYSVWTLSAWLADGPAYTREGFEENWQDGTEYYFVAAPRRQA